MKIQRKSRNVEVTDNMKEYIEKKLSKLNRIVKDDNSEVQVRLEKSHERYTVEITFKMRSIIVRAEETTSDFYASVDNAVNNLERRLKRYKDRFRILKRERTESFQTPGTEEKSTDKVVKVKKFELRPMNLDEALMQIDMLDHEFFVFRNVDNDQINVLYKRRDGNYGLIVPM